MRLTACLLIFLPYVAARGHGSNIPEDSTASWHKLQGEGIVTRKTSPVAALLFSLSKLANGAALPGHRHLRRPSSEATVACHSFECLMRRAAVVMEDRKDFSSRPITEGDVQVSFARSGGAGGQNVNKVNTKVDMRFNVLEADFLPEEVRLHLLEAQENSINNDGELIVQASSQRSQLANRETALKKLQKMIDASTKAVTPKEVNVEKLKKIKAGRKKANQRRLENKKKLSDKKTNRGRVSSW